MVPRYYPIFNLADSAIVCGGILTVILAMRGYHLDGSRSVGGSRVDGNGADEHEATGPGDTAPGSAAHGDLPAGPGASPAANAESAEPAESAGPIEP